MRSALAVSLTSSRRNRQVRGCIARIAFSTFALAGILAAGAGAVQAQDRTGQRRTWEFVVPSGLVVPTGAQGAAIRRGGLTALQLSRVVHPSIAITGTIGWARSRDLAMDGAPRLDVFTYDVGAEARAPRLLSRGRISISPFAGVGAGARTYNHRHLDVDATHNLAAYGSVGGTLGIGRVHLRLEARDYVSGFRPLVGEGAAATRNDVALLFGLRLGTR